MKCMNLFYNILFHFLCKNSCVCCILCAVSVWSAFLCKMQYYDLVRLLRSHSLLTAQKQYSKHNDRFRCQWPRIVLTSDRYALYSSAPST